MNVRDLMKTDIGACAPGDELVTVLLLMRDRRCGWAPSSTAVEPSSGSSRIATPRWLRSTIPLEARRGSRHATR